MKVAPPEADSLADLGVDALRELWRAHMSGPPPSRTTEILRREFAWRLMELTHGVMSASLRRQLDAAGRQALAGKKASAPRPETGSILVKVWAGRTYRVQVAANGYVLDGVTYPSLTRVAHKITGVHWSGPRFFGLNASRPQR